MPSLVSENFKSAQSLETAGVLAICASSGKRLCDVLRIQVAEVSVRSSAIGKEVIAVSPGINDFGIPNLDKAGLMGVRNAESTKLARPYICATEELALYGDISMAPVIELLKVKAEKKSLLLFEISENAVRKDTDFALHALRVNKCLDLKVRGFDDNYIMGFIGWKSPDMVANYCNHFSAFDIKKAKSFQDLVDVNGDIFISKKSTAVSISTDEE